MSVKDFFKDFKKGSLSTRQIILLIILIAGFLVILFFLFQLNLGEESKEQICRNSVMQANTVTSVSQNSLQCSTKYVCLTADGSCDEMASPDETIEVSSLDEVYEQLSEQKATCWWMFGEGQVDYVGDDLTQNNYCSICHQTHFDDSLNSIENVEDSISKDDLYEYMAEHNYSDKQTYAQYVLGTNDIDSLKERILSHENVSADEISFGEIEIGRTQFHVMGITSGVSGFKWSGIGGGAGVVAGVGVAALTLSNPVGWAGGAIVLGGAALGGTAGAGGSEIAEGIETEIGAVTLEGKGIENQFMAPTFQEAESDKFEALNCQDVLTDIS